MEKLDSHNILIKSLKTEGNITIKEVIKDSSFKILGETEVDLYIFTNKLFSQKIIIRNITNIKDTIHFEYKKSVRNVYINNKLLNQEIKELSTKNDINKLNANKLQETNTNEISGENDVLSSTFAYEKSVLNKRKVTLVFYNKKTNREDTFVIKTSSVYNPLLIVSRKLLVKKINNYLSMGYQPYSNDTKEIIELLHLK